MKRPSRSIRLSVRRLATAAGFAALLLAATPAARAVTKTYFGPDNGNWNTAGNWSPTGAPVEGDDVVLGTHSAGTFDLHINFNVSTQVPLNSVTLNSSVIGGQLTINQSASGTSLNTQVLNIGTTVPSNVWNQTNGGNYALLTNIGVNSSSNANNSYTISGGTFQSALNIGVSGVGAFNLNGGQWSNFNAGPMSPSILGVNAGSKGTFTITGGSASQTSREFVVGGLGTGVYNQTGGSAFLQNFIVAGTSTGVGTVNVTGGGLSAFDIIQLGGVNAGNGSTATLTVSGTGAVTGPLVVGKTGTFNLQSGGTFTVKDNIGPNTPPLLDGFIIENGGVFNVQGGVFTNAPILTLKGGAIRLNGYDATLGGLTGISGFVVNDGGSNSSGTLTLNVSQANVSFSGLLIDHTFAGSGVLNLVKNGSLTQTLNSAVSYTGTTTVNAGTLAAGSLLAFTQNSAYTVNGGILETNGYNQALGSLAGTGGSVNVSLGSLQIGFDNTFTTYAGTFTGLGEIDKVGSGQLTLNGSGSFAGQIHVDQGTLGVSATNGIPTGAFLNLTGSGAQLSVAADQTLGAFTGIASSTVNFVLFKTLSVGGNNGDDTYPGKFTGGGTLAKVGTGTFTLGSGASDTQASAVTPSSLTVSVASGTLALNKADGTSAIAGPLSLSGGTVLLRRGNQIADTSTLTINGGTFNLNGFSDTVGSLDGTGGTLNVNGAINVAQTTNKTYSGAVIGSGSFTKSGSADLVLTNLANYGGAFTANTGFLYLQGTVNATGGTANNGGVLNFVSGTANLNNGSITSNAGAFVQYFGATINNAFLRGSGPQIVVGNGYPASTFNNVTTYNSTVLTQNGGATFNNFTNGGTINNNAPATFNGGLNTITGTVNVKSTLATTDFGTSGLLNISSGGALSNTGSNLYAGGGSRTTINSGGTLSTANGTSIELNSALLVNNGTQTGTLNVNYGSTAKGTGTFGTVNVTDGGRFGVNATSAVSSSLNTMNLPSIDLATRRGLAATAFVGPLLAATPGAAKATSLTLGSGSVFAFNLQNASGAAGTGYDLVHSAGALTLSAGTTVGNQITVSVFSLAADGTSGLAANFDTSHSYQFILVQADGGITGFASGQFAVDTTGFQNSLNGGKFSVLQSGDNLVLAYNAVPEPGTWAAVGLGSVALGFVVLRRRSRG